GGASLKCSEGDCGALWAWENWRRRSHDCSGGGCGRVPEPIPAAPFLMAGLSKSASSAGVSGAFGRAALARVGRAGSLFGKFLGLSGVFAITPNMGRVLWRGKGGTVGANGG